MNGIHALIEFDFIHLFIPFFHKQKWISCRLSMKPSDVQSECIEVKGYPMKYGQSFPFDFNISAANIQMGPIASASPKSHVYGVFWLFDDKICEFYLSFGNRTLYDSYTSYLDGMLSSVALCQIGMYLCANKGLDSNPKILEI